MATLSVTAHISSFTRLRINLQRRLERLRSRECWALYRHFKSFPWDEQSICPAILQHFLKQQIAIFLKARSDYQVKAQRKLICSQTLQKYERVAERAWNKLVRMYELARKFYPGKTQELHCYFPNGRYPSGMVGFPDGLRLKRWRALPTKRRTRQPQKNQRTH